jgi:hypothetical protein
MYVNGKMRPAFSFNFIYLFIFIALLFICAYKAWDLLKLFQERGKEGIQENDGGGEFNYDIFDIV